MAKSPAKKSKSSTAKLGTMPVWNLADLYPAPDSPAFLADLALMSQKSTDFAQKWRGTFATHAAAPHGARDIFTAVQEFEQLEDFMGKIISYASLLYTEDTSDPQRGKVYGDVQEKVTAASSELLFFALELNRLDDALFAQLIEQAPLNHYKPWLLDLRKEKPYQLEDKLEQLFHEKSVTGHSAWNRLFDETISSLRFKIAGKSLSIEPALNFLQDNDPKKRKEAAIAVGKTLKENGRIFTLITNTLAKDHEIAGRWRGFKDVAESRHLSNRVEPEVVNALVSAVEAAYPRLSHRYYKLKAKWFGVNALNYYDRNAPLPDTDTNIIPYDAAKEIVLSAYAKFSPELARIGQVFFDKSWIDAPVREGKAPGAFAHPTVPSAHPFILLNYQGKMRDVMTMAHELGHGVHQVLAAPQGALMSQTPLTLAETASVFGEMLTFRKVLDGCKSAKEKRGLLAGKVEDMLNTVVRQIAFYTFERKVHEARKLGELTTDDLGRFWMDVQTASLGPAIKFGDDYDMFWAYIPHFIHSPFYVYAYAFGDCLVNSLYGRYEEASNGFAERYMALLAAGGSKHYSELLKPFNLDARDPQFWQIGLSLIERMIDELEKMEA